jgi:hypothetical protein
MESLAESLLPSPRLRGEALGVRGGRIGFLPRLAVFSRAELSPGEVWSRIH